MRRKVLPLIVLSCLSMSGSIAMAQDTWYVSPSGSDTPGNGSEASPFQTIHYAHDEAAAGDTIIVGAGTYDFQTAGLLEITKSITLLGAQADVDPWSTAGLRDIDIPIGESILSGSTLQTELIQINADDVTINGFFMTGDSLNNAIHTPSATLQSNLTVSHNIITRPTPGGNQFAVTFNNVANATASNNAIDGFGGSNVDGAMSLITAQNSSLVANEITRIGEADLRTAIYVSMSSPGTLIADNWIHTDVGKHGILLGPNGGLPNSVDVINNRIDGFMQAAISVRMPNVLVEGNTITGGFANSINQAAIYLRENNIANVIVRNNTVYDTIIGTSGRAAAVRIQNNASGQAGSILINNNEIFGNENAGVGQNIGFGMTDSGNSLGDCDGDPDVRNNWWGHSSGPAAVTSVSYLGADVTAGGYLDICDGTTRTTGSGDAAGRTNTAKNFSFTPWALFRGLYTSVDTGGGSFEIPTDDIDPFDPVDTGRYTLHAVEIPGLDAPSKLRIQSPEARLTTAEVLARNSAVEILLDSGVSITGGNAVVTVEYKPSDVEIGES